ncbi:MAG: hypothetical protein ABW202_07800 [Duganella sp.]
MKFSYAGAIAALTLASALTACGGKAQYTVQGTIDGLTSSGLKLTNNGGDEITVAAGATSFAFPKQIDYGTEYRIAITQDPEHMACQVAGDTGSAGYTVSISAAISCSPLTYGLTGQYTGVTPNADGTVRTITLINGSGGNIATITSASSSGNFAFTPIPYGAVYGVTVLPPTPGLNCTLQNGTGVMRDTPISNLLLTCVQAPT